MGSSDVVIVGAGVAGTALALALAAGGRAVTVLEARERTADGAGAWLTLAPNGVDALRLLGGPALAEAVTAAGLPTPRMEMRDARGGLLAALPPAVRDDGLPPSSVRRADLHAALRDAARGAGVDVRHGHRLVGLDQPERGPLRARLADGSAVEADVLVGADGVRSAVRPLLDPAAPAPAFTGVLNTGGFTDPAAAADLTRRLPGEPGTLQFAFGRRCFLGWVVDPQGSAWWFANPPARREPPRAELDALDDAAVRRLLLGLFADDDLPVGPLLDATPQVARPWPTHDLRRVPTWRRGRAVLIGDAAHAASPSSGQGASMALEDAVVLARCLRPALDGRGDESGQDAVVAALATYEAQRRRRAERVVVRGRRNGSQKAPGPVGRVVRDRVVMPLLAGAFRRAADAGRRPDAWLTDLRLEA